VCIVADPVQVGLLRAWADRSYTCLPIAHHACDSHDRIAEENMSSVAVPCHPRPLVSLAVAHKACPRTRGPELLAEKSVSTVPAVRSTSEGCN
jgi:hypothetical protein